MPLTKLIILFFTLYSIQFAHAQKCYFNKTNLPATKINVSVKKIEVENSIKKVMSVFGGFSQNFILKLDSSNNAYAYINATSTKNERIICYDGHFLSQIVNACKYNRAYLPILAHEVGHHLAGHTDAEIGSRKSAEADADLFSGFVSRRLGLTLDQTTAPYQLLASTEATNNYYSKQARINKVQEGWRKGGEGIFNIETLEQEKLECNYELNLHNAKSIYLRNQVISTADFALLNSSTNNKDANDTINLDTQLITVANKTPIKIVRSIGSCYEIKFMHKGTINQGYIAKTFKGKSTIRQTHYVINRFWISIALALIASLIGLVLYLMVKVQRMRKGSV